MITGDFNLRLRISLSRRWNAQTFSSFALFSAFSLCGKPNLLQKWSSRVAVLYKQPHLRAFEKALP